MSIADPLITEYLPNQTQESPYAALYHALSAIYPDLPQRPTKDILAGTAYAFSLLEGNERKAIWMFMVEEKDAQSISSEMNIPAENAYHLKRSGMTKLRLPSAWSFIRFGISGHIRKKVSDSYKRGYHCGYCDGYIAGSGETSVGNLRDGAVSELMDEPIEILGLSSGAYNCLKNCGLEHIKDVALLAEPQIRRIRNLGIKKAVEICRALEKAGILHTAWSRYTL